MSEHSFFVNIFWTNLPLILIGYIFIRELFTISSEAESRSNIFSAILGLLLYSIYICSLLLYIRDDEFLKLLVYILKLVAPIYIIYFMVGVKNKNKNVIQEAIVVIFMIFILGFWRVYLQ